MFSHIVLVVSILSFYSNDPSWNGAEVKKNKNRPVMAHFKIAKWAVVMVKCSACLPSAPTIRVRIPLKPTVFFCKICV